MDKAEIENILEEYANYVARCQSEKKFETFGKEINRDTATSSLTALIIKWLESKKVSGFNYNQARNQLITELVEELR
jgi:hypothetical protein